MHISEVTHTLNQVSVILAMPICVVQSLGAMLLTVLRDGQCVSVMASRPAMFLRSRRSEIVVLQCMIGSGSGRALAQWTRSLFSDSGQ